jgi:enoyl-CoA hydratase/carnithine racemase
MSRLSTSTDGPVLTLQLANPPLNTLDRSLLQELADVARAATRSSSSTRPRAIVLESAVANVFSHGIDPQAVLGTDVAGRRAIFTALAAAVDALWFGYVPIVADVSGSAFAGGAVLATLADFAIIDREHGKIAFSEHKVGLPLPAFVQRLVQAKIAPSAWNEVLLLGRNVDAAQALALGFANAVYGDAAERAEALKSLVGRIVRLPPAVLSASLKQARAPHRAIFDSFYDELGDFADFLTPAYLEHGLKAVLKGESPRF